MRFEPPFPQKWRLEFVFGLVWVFWVSWVGFWGFFSGFFGTFLGLLGVFGLVWALFWAPKRRLWSVRPVFAAGDQVEAQNVHPRPSPFIPFGLGVVGVRAGACVNCQSCLSSKAETEQVRAPRGTSSVRLRLGRAELRFDG